MEFTSVQEINKANLIEVRIRNDGKVVWINNEEGCLFRASNIEHLVVEDGRAITQALVDALARAVTVGNYLAPGRFEEVVLSSTYLSPASKELIKAAMVH